jgi:superfamily II DNA or RNA helicase
MGSIGRTQVVNNSSDVQRLEGDIGNPDYGSADDGDDTIDDLPSKQAAQDRNAERLKILQKSGNDDSSSLKSDHGSSPRRSLENKSEKIIDRARDYQQELFERAKEQNVIAVLDTGTGKTLIAAMLIRHFLEQQVDDIAAGKPGKTAFFLAER